MAPVHMSCCRPEWKVLQRCVRCIAHKYALIHLVRAATHDTGPIDHTLQRLWRALRPTDRPVPDIPGPEWKELGFQGADPASDLRAMGPLALLQLVDFAENCEQAPSVYREAQYGPYWYSFAAVSINVTASIVRYLLDGALDGLLYQSPLGALRIEVLNRLHAELLMRFHQKWMTEKPINLLVSFNPIYAAACREFITHFSHSHAAISRSWQVKHTSLPPYWPGV